MTRVKEESEQIGTRAGMIKGLAVTGGVITSAGIVLAATFSILTVLPLVGPTQIGLTVAIGVLIDALIVRSVLVPALGLDLGRTLWWPSMLWRREVQSDPGDNLVSTTEPPVSSTQ
jgi:RND superfamily putative drug exporter